MVYEPHFQNRDNDTHLDNIHDLGMDMEDLRPQQDISGWEEDLIENEFNNIEKNENNRN